MEPKQGIAGAQTRYPTCTNQCQGHFGVSCTAQALALHTTPWDAFRQLGEEDECESP